MKNKTKILLSTIAILSITGCGSSFDPKLSVKPTEYIEDLPSKKIDMPNNNGSLYGRGTRPLLGLGSENPLWGDRKALNVNDLVTVVIAENTESSSEGSKSNNSTTGIGLGGGVLAGGANAGSLVNKVANEVSKATDINFTANSERTFDAGGTNARSDTFETRVTVRVLKVMQNETYYIEGTKQLLINGEKQYLKVGGVIRAEDIGSNNEINSDKIADAKIFYTTEGDIQDSSKKGWGTKTIETLWPF
jgi:flagellar L-ring protein precursor FlgH